MSQWINTALGALVACAILAVPGSARAQDVMTPELLWQLKRVSAPAVSPDGRRLVYGIRTYDVAANKGDTDLFLLDVAGGDPVKLTDMKGSESSPAWRPDGQWIGFLSSKGGSAQLWEVKADGKVTREIACRAMGMLNVDEQGFDAQDRKLLLTIIEKFDGGPVGVDNLSAAIGEERGTIEDVLEPYLIQHAFIMRTPRGRMATRNAWLHCGLKPPTQALPEAMELFDGD